MMPSSPMFTTPERSESTPPSAAKISGVALISVNPASAMTAATNGFMWSAATPRSAGPQVR